MTRLRGAGRHGWQIIGALAGLLRRTGVLYFLVAGGLVVAVVLGIADAWVGTLSFTSGLALSLAALALIAMFRERRMGRILPFENLVEGDDHERLAGLASGFSELLDTEIRRIHRLGTERGSAEPSGIFEPASKRGETPGRRVKGLSGRLRSSTASGSVGVSDTGTLTLGPFNVPLGRLLRALSRFVGRAISGSVFVADQQVRVNIEWSGRPPRKWVFKTPLSVEQGSVQSMAREAATRIVWDLEGSRTGRGDWRSFGMLIDGLEYLEMYRQTSRVEHLDRAETEFSRAVMRSPEYAAAYYSLGVALEVHARLVEATDGNGIAPESLKPAEGMWEKALFHDPKLAEAYLELARLAADAGDLDRAVPVCRRALRLAYKGGLPTYPYHHLLGWVLEQRARSNGVERDLREALGHYRDAELDARHQRWLMRLGGATAAERHGIAGELAQIAQYRGRAWSFLAQASPRSGFRRRALRSAARALTTAIRYRRNEATAHIALGVVLGQLGRPERSMDHLIEALEIDRTNTEALIELGRLMVTSDFDAVAEGEVRMAVAAAAVRMAVALDPRSSEFWLILAEFSEMEEDLEAAISLAGVAAAIEPSNIDAHLLLVRVWKSVDDEHHAEATAHDILARVWSQADSKDAARSALRAIIKEGEFDPPAIAVFKRSLLWARSRDDPDAVTELSEQLESAGSDRALEDTLIDYEIGRLFLEMARRDQSPDDYAAAIPHLEAAVDLSLPSNLEVPVLWLLDLADAHAQMGDYETAVDRYTEVLDRPPPTLALSTDKRSIELYGAGLGAEAQGLGFQAQALAGRGDAYANLGKDLEALTDCREALRYEPRYAFPYLTLAEVHGRRREFELAQIALRNVVDLFPDITFEVHTIAGDMLMRAAEAENRAAEREVLLREAKQRLNSALAIARPPQDYVEARDLLIDCLELLGETEQAIIERQTQIDHAEGATAGNLHLGLARAYDDQGRYPEALEEFREACEWARQALEDSSPDDEATRMVGLADAHNELAWFLVEQLTRLDEALENADEAVRIARTRDDDDLRARCLDTKGWILHQSGQFEEAVEAMRESVDQAVPNSERRAHLALALEGRAGEEGDERARQADLGEAVRQWRLIIKLDPEGTWAIEAREHVQSGSRDVPRAAESPDPLARRPHEEAT